MNTILKSIMSKQLMKNIQNYKKKNKLTEENFKRTYIQKYYIYSSINQDNNIDNQTLRKNFKRDTKINLNLSHNIINKIRTNILQKYKNISFEELLNKKILMIQKQNHIYQMLYMIIKEIIIKYMKEKKELFHLE